jgi:UDP-glucuronate 4-epimerase
MGTPSSYLITGSAGFIGSHLVDRLLADGHAVVGIDNFDPYYDPRVKRRNIEQALQHPRYTFHDGDIRDLETLRGVFSRHAVDTVVHLAAKAGVRPSIENPIEYADANIRGTVTLLEAMKGAGVKRMLFASSSSVYGNQEKVPFSETDVVNRPISPYAATKLAGEQVCHTYTVLHGFHIWCMRFFTVYGPRQRPEMAIARFLHAALRREPITVYGDGTMERDFTFIADIVEGLVRSLRVMTGYEVVNIGGVGSITLNDLLALVEKTTGVRLETRRAPVPPGDVRRTSADQTRFQSLLGSFVRTSPDVGLKHHWEWMLGQEDS